MIIIPRRKQKIKYSRKFACKYLAPKGDISNNLQPLCYCSERDLILGQRAFVCQVCYLYSQVNHKIIDLFEESKRIAENKLKEKELESIKIEDLDKEDELDLSIDEFEEDEESIPTRFEKRKVGKGEIEDSEEFTETVECPFCGELFDNVASHIQSCEFAPDDASIDDIIPIRGRKKKRRKKPRAATSEAPAGEKSSQKKKKCPYCGKEFIRLGRHLNSCKKRPKDKEETKEKE